jgi:hypothetical protein
MKGTMMDRENEMPQGRTYYVIGEIPDDEGGQMPVEEETRARTRTDARLYMRLVYPGIRITQIDLLEG